MTQSFLHNYKFMCLELSIKKCVALLGLKLTGSKIKKISEICIDIVHIIRQKRFLDHL